VGQCFRRGFAGELSKIVIHVRLVMVTEMVRGFGPGFRVELSFVDERRLKSGDPGKQLRPQAYLPREQLTGSTRKIRHPCRLPWRISAITNHPSRMELLYGF
jgi:hypothetical protein